MDIHTTRHRIFDTPAGDFWLICGSDGAMSARWDDGMNLEGSQLDPDLQPRLSAKLQRYFRGEPEDFLDVPIPAGPTFHRRCWEVCRTIPGGETRSYGALATMAGAGPGASRAAGQAMRRNPLPVIVPCHRILAADGRLHGYSGSIDPAGRALAIKRSLLELERSTRQ